MLYSVSWLHAGAIATDAVFVYGSGSGPIFLDEVQCRGSESRLISCQSAGLGRHDCEHFEDAAVVCNRSVTPCKYCASYVGVYKTDWIIRQENATH